MHRTRQSWIWVGLVVLPMVWGTGAFGQLDGDISKAEPVLQREAQKLVGQRLPAAPGPAEPIAGPPQAAPFRSSPALRELMRIPDRPGRVHPSLVSTESRNGVMYLDTFIELAPGASTEALEALGVEIGSRSGDIVTADVPPEQLDEVSALPEVVRIAGSRYVSQFNDQATLEPGIQTVWTTTSNRGANAIVGVDDSGIDWTHGDFKHANNTSRILYIWDQTDDAGPPPSGYSYGSLWTQQQINSGVVREQDNSEDAGGHGTHVTGTAAGDGSATGNGQPADRFVGVANQADIIFTKTRWTDQSIADACTWMYSTAGTVGKPIAINLSLGGIGGPHDGSTALELFLNGLLSQPGRALCIAAGNSGGQPIHAFSTLVAGTGDGNNLDDLPVVAFWAYPIQGFSVSTSVVELWYPAGSSVQWRPVWQGDQTLVVGDWMGATSNQRQYTISGGPLNGVGVSAASQIPFNDGRNVLNYGYVVVESPQGGAALNGWVFYVQFNGTGVPVHVWHIIRDMGSLVPGQVFVNSGMTPPQKLLEPDDGYTVGSPGTADDPICVGSYVTKVNWTDINGQTQTQQGATMGEISGFSSRGPRRDGQQKPDVTAPGEAVLSSLSSVLTQRPASDIERDGVHQKMQGTSMASPVVAGLAALMLSKNPALTNAQVKNILRSTARDAGAPGWDALFGAGKIDAVAALAAVSGGGVNGDVNGDGFVDVTDAIRVSRHVAGLETLTGDALAAADADESGAVNNADVDWILEKTVGLR